MLFAKVIVQIALFRLHDSLELCIDGPLRAIYWIDCRVPQLCQGDSKRSTKRIREFDNIELRGIENGVISRE